MVASVTSASGASLAFVVGILSSAHACAETTLGEKQELQKIVEDAQQVCASSLSFIVGIVSARIPLHPTAGRGYS